MAYLPLPDPTADMLTWALWYAAIGWPVFPCHGKVPFLKGGFQIATCDAAQIISWWDQWPTCNIGSPIQPATIVLDIDPRHGGDDTLYHLEQAYGELPPTLTSHTGGGGWHKWVTTPRPVRNKANLGEGIDIQGVGSYVILPPSLHPDTGNRYLWDVEWGIDDIEPQDAPEWLLVLLEAQTRSTPRERATAGASAPGAPILEGRRESTLMQLAGAMQRIGATYEAIRAALEAENQRCVPPLEPDALDRMAHSVGRYAPEPTLQVRTQTAHLGWSGQIPAPGVHAPGWDIPVEQTGWYREAIDPYTNKRGIITANNTTILALLRNHPAWHGQFWWDDMASKMMWGADELTDHRITDLGSMLGQRHAMPIHSDAILFRCLLTICREHPQDPLQNWLKKLAGWDGTPRLSTWLLTCAGVPDRPYARYCAQMLIISMIARAWDPGCICRTVIILEGPEEYRKSTFVAALVPFEHWYAEITGSLESKEAHLMVQGLWVAELSELDSLGRTEETRLKSFISMRADAYIPKFKMIRVHPKRRAIFVGTTNEHTYLKGVSGNTRYLPFAIMQPMDVEYFLQIREQLFAEAMVFYHDHPTSWWHMTPDVHTQAVDERESRRQTSIYESDLHDWLTTRRFQEAQIHEPAYVPIINETYWAEIASGYLKLDSREKWKDSGLQRQIAQALRATGWVQHFSRNNGIRTRVWRWKQPPF